MVFLIAGVGNLTGTLLAGVMSSIVSPRRLASGAILVLVLAIGSLPLLRRAPVMCGGVFLWMLAGGATFTTMQGIITRLSDARRGALLAVNNGCMWLGTAVGSGALSLVVGRWGFPTGAWSCAGAALAASLILQLALGLGCHDSG